MKDNICQTQFSAKEQLNNFPSNSAPPSHRDNPLPISADLQALPCCSQQYSIPCCMPERLIHVGYCGGIPFNTIFDVTKKENVIFQYCRTISITNSTSVNTFKLKNQLAKVNITTN